MRSSRHLFLFALCASAAALTAQAQETAKPSATAATPPAKVSAVPPKVEPVEETLAPSVTIPTPNTERKITQKREQGKVTEVQVKTGKSTYTVKPNNMVGNSVPGDVQSSSNHAVQWKVMEFNLGEKKTSTTNDNAGTGVKPSASAPQPPKLIPDPTVK